MRPAGTAESVALGVPVASGDGVNVAVGVGVRVGVGDGKGVADGSDVCAAVGSGAGVAVGDGDGVSVPVGAGVSVVADKGVGVAVALTGVSVGDGNGVGVAVALASTGVMHGAGVAVAAGSGDAVDVARSSRGTTVTWATGETGSAVGATSIVTVAGWVAERRDDIPLMTSPPTIRIRSPKTATNKTPLRKPIKNSLQMEPKPT